MSRFAKCSMFADDCHAYLAGGYCRCLANTDFGIKPCPFYKSVEQNEKERREIKNRFPVTFSASKARG